MYTSLIPRDLAQRNHASRVVGSGSTIMLWLAYHTPVPRGHTVAVGAGLATDAAHHQLAKTSPEHEENHDAGADSVINDRMIP